MNNIITQKGNNPKSLNTLLTINIKGDGLEVFDYNLPTPTRYERVREDSFQLEYVLNGVFWTNKSREFINDILLRFSISMDVKNINIKTIKKDPKIEGTELKEFSGSSCLNSLVDEIQTPNAYKYEDSAFWGIKLFVIHYIRRGASSVDFDTILDYAYNHFIDNVEKSTLKSKCKSIYNYYENNGWKVETTYTKLSKKEKDIADMNRLEHVKKIQQDKVLKSRILIKSTIEALYEKGEKLTQINIAKYSKLSRKTIGRHKEYVKEVKNNLS